MTIDATVNHNRDSRLEDLVGLTEFVNTQSRHGLKMVLKAATEKILDFFSADFVVIYPYNPDKRLFYDVDNITVSGLKTPRSPKSKPRQKGLAAIIREINILVIEDLGSGRHGGKMHPIDTTSLSEDLEQSSILTFAAEEKFVENEGVKAFMGISLQTGRPGDTQSVEVGVMYIDYTKPRRFSDEDVQFLKIIGHQLASTIQYTRLLERRNKDIEILEAVNRAITHSTPEEMGKLIAKTAVQLTDSAYGTLWLLDGSGESLIIGNTSRRETKQSRLPLTLSRSTNVRSVVSGKSYVCNNVMDDPYYLKWYEDIKSTLTVPLHNGTRVIGTLHVEHELPSAYSKYHRRLLEALAGQSAIAIENARIFIQSNERRNLLTQIIHGSSVPMFAIDREHNVTHWNRACEELTGFEEFRIVGTTDHWRPFYQEKRPLMADLIVDGQLGARVDDLYDEYRQSTYIPDTYEAVSFFKSMGRNGKWLQFSASSLKDQDDQVVGAIETFIDITDRQKSQERKERIKSVRDIWFGVISGQNPSLDLVLAELLERTTRLMWDATAGEIWLLEDQVLTLYAQVGEIADGSLNEFNLGHGVVGHVANTREPFLSTNVVNESIFIRRLVNTLSEIAVPLLNGNECIGVLNIEHPDINAFDQDDIELLETIASQVVVAIDQTNRQNRRSSILAGIYERIISIGIGDEDAILDLLFEESRRLMSFRDALFYIAFYNEKTDMIRFGLAVEYDDGVEVTRVRWGRQSQTLVEAWQPRERRPAPGLTEHVLGKNATVHIPSDFYGWASRNDLTVWKGIGYKQRPTQSWLGVPMRAHKEMIGIISIQSLEKEYAFNKEDIELLESIADRAAIAISSARLYQEARAETVAAKQLATLGTATAALEHRMNNTVSLIVPNVNRLKKRVNMNDKEIQDILSIIERNASSTARLIKRLQEPLKDLKPQLVNINSVLEELIDTSRNTTRPNMSFSIETNLEPEVPLVHAPIGQITEIFRNLIENAIRVLPNPGTIAIKSAMVDGMIRIWFTDNGPGIPEAKRSYLFRQPVTSTSSESHTSSSGLGLWLSGLMLESFGGNIGIEDTGPNGTTMLVTLPGIR